MGVRKLDSQKYIIGKVDLFLRLKFRIVDAQERTLFVAIRRKRKRNMRNKSCGNGSKNCVACRNAMRNEIAIGNPSVDTDDSYYDVV